MLADALLVFLIVVIWEGVKFLLFNVFYTEEIVFEYDPEAGHIDPTANQVPEEIPDAS